jgi:exonuclease VII small subunit
MLHNAAYGESIQSIMSSTDEIGARFKHVLSPYILPREEASYRRRILALHLKSSIDGGVVSAPLALVNAAGINQPPDVRGLQRDYLRALDANLVARDQHEKMRKELLPRSDQRLATAQTDSHNPPNPLEEHLVKVKTQRKQAKLQAVEKHIGLLNQKGVAASGYLDPEDIFKDTRALPDVPADVVNGIALGPESEQPGLQRLIDRLEKQVFKAKMLLKGEAQLLDSVKSRSTARLEEISDYAKLTALNATRTELINWMETELGKASPSPEEDGQEDVDRREEKLSVKAEYVDEQLATIKVKYTQYLAARKALLQLVGQKPQPTIMPLNNPNTISDSGTRAVPAPVTYLLTPNLESLLSIAHETKGLINLKSHLNTTVNKQLKESGQTLDHLAEESHLLPSYPMPGASRRKLGPSFGDLQQGSSEDRSSTTKVKPWVHAADSAKIATLEAVTEKMEEGQVALEGSVRTLQEIDQLLGRTPEEKKKTEEVTEDDMRLAETKTGEAAAVRKHARTASKVDRDMDLWSFLDGSLGLLKASYDTA